MPLPRAILFVDGENLTMRFQAMVAAGARPKNDTIHEPDVFVWRDSLVGGDHHRLENIVRTYYYTSVVGDELQVAEIKRQLARIEFSSRADDGSTTGNIVPVVFKKPARSQKTRNVDIRVVLDIMRFAFTDEVDRVYLASGDGDYLPLIDEVMRRGKQLEVLAFSSGLHGALQYSVDRFHNLDLAFFSQ
jgi:uncharacterized LabA/DUF88 family protein